MRHLKCALLAGAAVGLGLAVTTPASARVTQFEITSRAEAFDGKTFGDAGAYEKIVGIARFAIDPRSPRGQRIVGLAEAPVNGACGTRAARS